MKFFKLAEYELIEYETREPVQLEQSAFWRIVLTIYIKTWIALP